MWTLVHNGHIFDAPALRKYLTSQKGSTDSERILCYITDEAGKAASELTPASDDRIALIDRITRELAPENKLNYILFDGELMYVHANEPGGLYVKSDPHSKIFSTKPLTATGWEALIAPAVRCVTLLIVAAVVAHPWRKTRMYGIRWAASVNSA